MKNVEVVVRQELFDVIGVDVSQLSCRLDDNHDFMLCGSVSAKSKNSTDHSFYLKASLCDKEDRILYVAKSYKSYNGMRFELINYDTFSIYSSDVSRYLDEDELHHIELYPNIAKEEK